MNRPRSTKASKSGFTLLEIIVAVAILVLLIGAVSLNAGTFVGRGKTGRVMKFVDGLKMACAAYHADMGSYAYEYSGYPPVHQKLSSDQAGNWDGPYIDNPITRGQNPFGGNIHLYNTVTANNWIPGFDLNGDGAVEVTGSGNMLWMSAVPQESAESIDRAMDGELAGTWSDAGRVRYNSSNRYMFILVYN